MNLTATPSRLLGKEPPTLLLILAIISGHSGAAFAYCLFPSIGPLGTVSLRTGISAVVLIAATRPALAPPHNKGGWMIVLYGLLLERFSFDENRSGLFRSRQRT